MMTNEDKLKETYSDIKDSDFELVQVDKKISDVKFETKQVTFFKDAMKRFAKNKSSVVGAFILGLLLLLALFVPVLDRNDVVTIKKPESFLAPKLFKAGTGFWDGVKSFKRIIYDTQGETPADFYKPAVISIKIDSEPSLIDQASPYGHGGMAIISNETRFDEYSITLNSPTILFTADGNYRAKFILGDEDGVLEGVIAEYAIYFVSGSNKILVQDFSKKYGEININISEILKDNDIESCQGYLSFEVKGVYNQVSYILMESATFETDDPEGIENVNNCTFTDATQMVLITKDNEGVFPPTYWACTGRKGVHNSSVYFCDFSYDTYAAAFDTQDNLEYSATDVDTWIKNGWCEYDPAVGPSSFKKLSDKCPIDKVNDQNVNKVTGKLLNIVATGPRYRKYGYTKMPVFILGTDTYGHDIFKKAFKGLRTSLILGICTAAFCFAFGLCWGSISGYFGGNVDLFMERFCDILSGVPWIVIMTLCILHLGNNFFTFFLALCMTGWMGVAGRTRTQFYRFKGREYVLASRTLGSSDTRLIFKHILPNSLGTIITSSVLMIPSVIFSESTLAYLNLGLQGVQSFGVMLSENQQYLATFPNLIIFPAVILALMMISFNLFGNGLRDALNPSLKGSE